MTDRLKCLFGSQTETEASDVIFASWFCLDSPNGSVVAQIQHTLMSFTADAENVVGVLLPVIKTGHTYFDITQFCN